MTTHAYIGFRTRPGAPHYPAVVYQHNDGYPDGEHGVLAVLAPYVQRFVTERGSQELDLLAAGVMRAFEWRIEARRAARYEELLNDPDPVMRARAPIAYGEPSLLGTRIMVNIDLSPSRHDQSYVYLVDAQGGIEVRPPLTDEQGNPNPEQPRFINTRSAA
ncbi:hypothetical protein [Deinococcus soli (ex Cha et al. 2016)]|uniref:Uncharacterized protein n=2 Tax=Deinococcus soli (ex Cha et al. 2016) TaxID=1309411 RepID=A0ACC6KHE2_9DEIO|nr:hypothetical protein [Deinococcus soli (ex Cha et al. 2016)]MDR6218869.1 hypothetical protein [Deinococcus soli (ex Cha et al. 2016)]MDR6328666.1 hypothetical protein [Deinococcus soli (ex Cha et al. 2016)]MDR6751847.1 hypothetical protein [Deinococcus soli (ex Cha et al. 2016)]